MTGSDHASHWLEMLKAEIGRRRAARLEAAGDGRERLYAELDEMAARVRAVPNYVDPGTEQKALDLQELDRFFAEHYPRRG
jgi:hypothetical protein